MRKILIANRGEIACRIARTCHMMGIESVAIYSFADRHARHVTAATEARAMPVADNAAAYLAIDDIIAIARQTGCDAIHPGYGFLAENATFSASCSAAGLTFIGPTAEAMQLLGDKKAARQRAAATGVDTAPGSELPDDAAAAEKAVVAFFKTHGGPALLKATAGGGGKGMRRLESASECKAVLLRASAEAQKLFGNGSLYIEQCIEQARHIEVQFVADQHGSVGILFDRDCSVQRNNQKIIEEGPASNMSVDLRQRAYSATTRLIAGSGYHGAGTAEFLLSDSGQLFFLEVNARLQVEHPVTEMITDLDLVELQLRIARGENISSRLPSSEIPARHCIELRICAETADGNFHPSSGRLQRCVFPEGNHIRVDTGFAEGDFFSPYYDSLLAKLIVTGDCRNSALELSRAALAEIQIAGVETNCSLLKAVLEAVSADTVVHTSFLGKFLAAYSYSDALAAAACRLLAFEICASAVPGLSPHWSAAADASLTRRYRYKGTELTVTGHTTEGTLLLRCNTHELRFDPESIARAGDSILLPVAGLTETVSVFEQNRRYWIQCAAGQFMLEPVYRERSAPAAGGAAESIVAELPGALLKVCVAAGDQIPAGGVVAVLESMKMEHEIRATADGTVAKVHCSAGQQVAAGDILFELIA